MHQLIIHACGHEQAHFLSGFTSQQERKARWLQTTKCQPCFVAEKRAEQAEAAARDGDAIAHLNPPQLIGSDRQVAWATTLRAGRLSAIVAASPAGDADGQRECLLVTDAKWWIDHRDLTDADLLAKAKLQANDAGLAADSTPAMSMPQAAYPQLVLNTGALKAVSGCGCRDARAIRRAACAATLPSHHQ